MLKIVIISPFYYPSNGGVESIVKNTAEELAKRKHKVIVVTTNYSNSWVKLSEESKTVENGVTIYRVQPLSKVGYAAILRGLIRILEKEQPDIVHAHNLHPHLFQAIYSKSHLKFKIVVQLHYPLATGIDHLSAKLFFPMVMKLMVHNQRKVDAFIVHSSLEEKWLMQNGIKETRISKLRFPCFSYTSKEYTLSQLSIDRKSDYLPSNLPPFDILSIGRITKRKGIHVLLQALSQLKDLDISTLIVGHADKVYLQSLQNLSTKLGLKNVYFLPPVSEQTKFRLIDACKIFVVPSILDYTPVTVIEAQAMGKPVISTHTGAIFELVRGNETGILVEPQNVEALAEAIRRLILNKEKRLAMGDKAYSWIIENFSMDGVVDRLEEIYSKILLTA